MIILKGTSILGGLKEDTSPPYNITRSMRKSNTKRSEKLWSSF
jgi:hypothetical protein